jgi:hypothetical protein
MALQPDAMRDAMEAAYELEWPKVKPNPLPGTGKDDRLLLFAGVARGLLQYLSDHHNELLTSLTTQDDSGVQATYQVQETDLGIDLG